MKQLLRETAGTDHSGSMQNANLSEIKATVDGQTFTAALPEATFRFRGPRLF